MARAARENERKMKNYLNKRKDSDDEDQESASKMNHDLHSKLSSKDFRNFLSNATNKVTEDEKKRGKVNNLNLSFVDSVPES